MAAGECEMREVEGGLEETVASLMRELEAPAVDGLRARQLLRAAQSQLRYLRFVLLVRGGCYWGRVGTAANDSGPPSPPPLAPSPRRPCRPPL